MNDTTSLSSLQDFVEQHAPEGSLKVEEDLGCGFVRLRVDEAERRQAKDDIQCLEDALRELLRNARDASAKHIYVAHAKTDDMHHELWVLDDGQGIPEKLQARIFDPRVTSKLQTAHMDTWGIHGRGMALFSIRQNCETAKVLTSKLSGGSAFKVVSDMHTLHEKKDQSTWPQLKAQKDQLPEIISGPHNLIRLCCEFQLAHMQDCRVYFGSPTEILSLLIQHVHKHSTYEKSIFAPLAQKVCLKDLEAYAKLLDMNLSKRTLQRLAARDIAPAKSCYAYLVHACDTSRNVKNTDIAHTLYKDQRKLSITKQDREAFAHKLTQAFEELARTYYLELQQDPDIRVSREKIVVTYTISEED